MIRGRAIVFTLALIPGLALGFLLRPANLQADFIRGAGTGGTFTCGTSTVEGVGSITYGTVVGEDGNCWLDRNLGATQVATAVDDTAAYGYHYQWGRLSDGHQISTSGTTTTLSSTDVPGNADFILAPNYPKDWRDPQSDNLWQGLSGTNNPCPTGFRLATAAEWEAYATAAGIVTVATGYDNNLKLPVGGIRSASTGAIANAGGTAYYWTSDINGVNASRFSFVAATVGVGASNRAAGAAVRCIKD
jgi:uncharacterized protein (TIGR02145 family)